MKIRHLLLLLTVVFTLSSCEIFTTSVGKGLARDNSKIYDKQSSSDLVELASSAEAINDPEISAQILEALGRKEDLTSLSGDQKNTVLNLMIGATITSDAMSSVVENFENLSGDGDIQEIIEDMLNSIGDADTAAVSTLLSDNESLSQLDPLTGCLASLCLIAQVARDENLTDSFSSLESTIGDATDVGNDTDNIVESIQSTLGTTFSESSANALNAALNCIQYYSNNTNGTEQGVFGGFSVSDIFGAFGNH